MFDFFTSRSHSVNSLAQQCHLSLSDRNILAARVLYLREIRRPDPKRYAKSPKPLPLQRSARQNVAIDTAIRRIGVRNLKHAIDASDKKGQTTTEKSTYATV